MAVITPEEVQVGRVLIWGGPKIKIRTTTPDCYCYVVVGLSKEGPEHAAVYKLSTGWRGTCQGTKLGYWASSRLATPEECAKAGISPSDITAAEVTPNTEPESWVSHIRRR